MTIILSVILSIALIVVLLFSFGLVGPTGIRERIRWFNRWADRDTFLSVDPYKPLLRELDNDVADPSALTEPLKQLKKREWILVIAIVGELTILIFLICALLR